MFRLNVGLLAASLVAPGLFAAVIEPNPNLPPADPAAVYTGPGWTFNFAGSYRYFNVQLSAFSASFLPPQDIGLSATHSFNTTVAGQFSFNSGPFTPFTASGAATYQITKVGGPNGSSFGLFATEMLALNIGGLPPPVAMIRESPTLASTGQTTISPSGGGTFQIDSFFDVFTELSLDGGQSWIPSTGSSRETLNSVPEPSGLLLAGAGLAWLWRRRK
jgi:MYXO-CTERM domain-containing protein